MSKYKLSNAQKVKVDKAIRYAKKFDKFPYKLCGYNPPNISRDYGPFWFQNETPPELNIVKKGGLSCVGLANLIRRFMGLEVPGNVTGQKLTPIVKKWPGSTSAWYHYLNSTKRLEKIDFEKVYPKGTLLVQNYNVKDQGHVSITINSSKYGLLNSKIIHSIYDRDKERDIIYKEVTIQKLKDYCNYRRHTHICLPQNWILKN